MDMSFTEDGGFWVSGGRYADFTYSEPRWTMGLGPFSTLDDAEACQRDLCYIYSHDPLVRFTIEQKQDTPVA